ncbi:acyl CoA:acetate/3-ketoacid CoA transferase [Desulfosarcina ovata subsp. sediminis]|uniref:Acyl CoA:acetate/3-ketoacid CoA transferase n=1 Tax=Desulfosarcina ovata subsp. sediminis TaxID=885957 RepID=A0A5K8A0B4_9BACT|nr:acyl CoA:acetate/3-ketoacid CoA transferase [Desulfosarcina ovata]BBO85952.1 acyl CoA:acetate/3-ketoacid CoA transferase [Desulfosarcina ovata subsp. sediminis]
MVVECSLADTSSLMSFLKEHQPYTAKRNKVVSAEDAVRVIQNGDTVVFGGFAGIGVAEEIAAALENYYLRTRHPRDLTLMFAVATGPGDDSPKGLNHLAHEGMLKRIIGGHWGLAPGIQRLAVENKVVAYNLPQGIISHMYRNVASGKAGLFSQVGLGTFVDPRNGGGRLNERTTEPIVQLMEIAGEEYLFYDALPINVAVIRGTTADTDGNITMEKEALTLESLSIAMAAKNSGGLVIVQVERVAQAGTLNSRQVKIPGILVDCVVVACPENHWQTFGEPYNPAFSGEIQIPTKNIPTMQMSARKVIARRAAFELKPNCVVNLGIGVPEGVASVANEEKILDFMTLTAEPGVIGGLPVGGLNFGAAINATALVDQPYQFDFYNGGGVDVAFLGMAEADAVGNVNVSRFGVRLAGAGGFINISQNSKKVIFMGTFTAGGVDYEIGDGKLIIKKEGRFRKFVEKVQHITFSGPYSAKSGRKILYVTERCVFELGPDGLELIEIAPGVDLQKDILDMMDFKPTVREPLVLMDERIFSPNRMLLKDDLLTIPAEDRMFYNPEANIMLINLAGHTVKSTQDVDAIRNAIERIVKPLGKRVDAVANYDQFRMDPDLIDEYSATQKYLADRYFSRVSRYTTSAFLRIKIGEEMENRGMAPHIFETPEEAHAFLVTGK